MPCYHPMKAFVVGTNPDTGKRILKVKPYSVQYIYKIEPFENEKYDDRFYSSERSLCPNVLNCDEKLCTYQCLDAYLDGHTDGGDITSLDTLPRFKRIKEVYYEFITIPCGQCIGCRIDKSREWANRMMLELPYSSSSWFVTFTYNDEHLPITKYKSPDFAKTGELLDAATLDKKQFQRFNKRLRKHFGNGIRFYAAGEYGSKSFRPHYHAIYFNLPLNDLKFYKRSFEGFNYYTSETLNRLWSDPLTGESLGFVVVTEVTWQTCAYVARYVTKKRTGVAKSFYEYFNIEPEFSIMSRRPGLGRAWFDEHGKDAYRTYIIRLNSENGPIVFKPPGYFDSLYDIDCHEELEEIKEMRRKMLENKTRLKLSKTDKGYLEMLSDEESNFKSRTKSLSRGDV